MIQVISKKERDLHVLMIGPVLSQNGGMASVERLLIRNCPSGISLRHLASHDEGSVFHRLVVFGLCWLRLLFAMVFSRVDLVYVHVSEGGSLARKATLAWLARCFGKPVVVHTHGAEFVETYDHLSRYLKTKVDRLFQRSVGVVALSNSWKDCYVSLCSVDPSKILVLTNPTELPRQIPNRGERDCSKVKILFCGRVGKRKGTFDLINAFHALPANLLLCAELVIAGDGELEQAKSMIAERKLDNKVSLVGWVGEQTREKLLAESDIFILPSYNEGLPMAILEAMGWELPVISTNVGGIPELVRHQVNGLILEAGDVAAITHSIATMIEQQSLRLKYGQCARKSVESFDIHPYWGRLESYFRDCLRSHR